MTEDDIRRLMAHEPTRSSEDSWEHGPDAVRDAGDPSARVEARVLLLFGDQAEVLTPHHGALDPLRVPAAKLADELGVEVAQLPGVRFLAVVDGDELREVVPMP
ncbi:hypothetical protein [Nonomuraea dietziae]|uniref:hypothetical protein n=1 Tax=Nonomuraea dietziae TaxID=65515 RepID=UPI0034431637